MLNVQSFCNDFLLLSHPLSPNLILATNIKPHNAQVDPHASSSTTPWLLDSGASHHVTNDLANLSIHAPYDGTEELIIGDGKGLFISHIGSLTINFCNYTLHLNNVLCVPNILGNIVSISRLCHDNEISINFSSNLLALLGFVNDYT